MPPTTLNASKIKKNKFNLFCHHHASAGRAGSAGFNGLVFVRAQRQVTARGRRSLSNAIGAGQSPPNRSFRTALRRFGGELCQHAGAFKQSVGAFLAADRSQARRDAQGKSESAGTFCQTDKRRYFIGVSFRNCQEK